MNLQIAESRRALVAKGLLAEGQKGGSVLFDFPIANAPDLAWNSAYAISNFKDHDSSTGILDYQCGNRTYDGHQGIDYYLWPFPHHLMDNDLVWAVSAAPGTVIYKTDGHFDQECAWALGLMWNAVYVEHADGTIAWYGHLKEGSLTTKSVGETVEAGEYLGVIGSSGNSTGPHLHFELHASNGQTIDPNFGECNVNASATSWADQPAYFEMKLNAILTHDALPVFGCPSANEEPHLADEFQPGDLAYFTAHYKDQQAGVNTHYTVYRPNGTVFFVWDHSAQGDYYSAWWYWTLAIPVNAPTGTWTFVAEVLGESYTHSFTVGDPAVSISENFLEMMEVYPNPSEDVLFMNLKQGKYINPALITMLDITGRTIGGIDIERTGVSSWRADVSPLKSGIYFLRIETSEGIELKKWIKG